MEVNWEFQFVAIEFIFTKFNKLSIASILLKLLQIAGFNLMVKINLAGHDVINVNLLCQARARSYYLNITGYCMGYVDCVTLIVL